MLPGLVGLVLQFLIPMITATAIVREKERGNIEQLLVTPIKSYELIIGKILPYIAIGMIHCLQYYHDHAFSILLCLSMAVS